MATSLRRVMLLLLVVEVTVVHVNGDGELAATPVTGKPSLRSLINAPSEVVEGEDALLTCIVRNIGGHTVFWSRLQDGKRTILTVDKILLTRDTRFSVLHDGSAADSPIIRAGGDVWVLAIKTVTPADAGAYVCQVNSNPPLQTLFRLTVESNSSQSPEGAELRSQHNYTRCCQTAGVSPKCLGYCSIHTLLEGAVGVKEEECEEHLGEVVRCMADQRNHVPCCRREGVPDICQELCRGEYTAQDDYVKSHFSCASYLQATLTCISEGIGLLPRPPVSPIVKVLDSSSLNVSWQHPLLAPSAPDTYVITVTPLQTFDPPEDFTSSRSNPNTSLLHLSGITIKRYVTKVPVNVTFFIQKLLKPLTWYEIEVTSENRHGSSLPPYTLRSLTRPEYDPPKRQAKTIRLPDVMSCCVSKGVTHDTCLTKLCNPHNERIDEPDMIVCAPWAQEAFSCLAGDYDHSDCCRQRGLPDVCVELCTGNVKKIDYKYFRCVDYFTDYRGCLMKGYGVLPSRPIRVKISNIYPTNALLSWSPPLNNSQSVTSYHSYYRPIEPERNCMATWITDVGETTYKGVYSPSAPFVLENLCPDTEYEIYIQAFNSHGTSDPSDRILFRTISESDLEENQQEYTYNLTACCKNVLVSPGCMPLCDYNARMSHVRALTTTCVAELSRVLRCQVGGRNHASCCTRRGVPDTCMSLCTGTYIPDTMVLEKCNAYIGNVVLCLEDGVGLLPAPVTSLHLTSVQKAGVTLVWEAPTEGANFTLFQVHYQSVDSNSGTLGQFALNRTINTTDTVAIVSGLEDTLLYSFFVVALNENGASLPSSVVHLNVSSYMDDITRGVKDPSHPIAGVPSAPHSLRLVGKTATSLTILWEPPELALPTDRFRYTINYSTVKTPNSTTGTSNTNSSSSTNSTDNSTVYNITRTSSSALKLEALKPNTQYVIYVSATNDMGDSRASETLLAWTDPAYPAFVETPTVHPTSLVVEGSSVTVLCIAMGSPPPTVSLYIAGILVHQDVTRHMVTVVKNITRNMTDISCYADNGYGTPMQSSISITISRPPHISAPTLVHTTLGRRVTVQCGVDAWPHPSVVWWRDPDGRVPVISGGNYRIATLGEHESKGEFTMQMEIKSVNESDAGDFYCFARNAFGTAIHKIKVLASPPVLLPPSVSACCRASNVTDACIDACDFDEITTHDVLSRDLCIPEFDKLVRCAADGSDHRSCCSQRGVPVSCLDWCRQEPVDDNRACLLQWAPAIFACFDEGRATLPGPPANVRILSASDSAATVHWDPPGKNPGQVELYRVFWRVLGQRVAQKNDTTLNSLKVSGLRPGLTYEVAVKAGNHKGTSVLTPTITYRHGLSYVSSASTHANKASVGVAVGIAIAVLTLLLGLVSGLWWGWRRRCVLIGKMSHSSSQSGISFENPSYIKEQNGDTIQIAETPNGSLNGTIASELNKGTINGSVSTANGGGSIGLSRTEKTPQVGGVWSTQQGANTPGFEDDIKNNGKYCRFNS